MFFFSTASKYFSSSHLNKKVGFDRDNTNKILEIGYGFEGVPSASFRDIKKRNGLILFLEFLGEAYMSGVTMNLSNLYPSIEHPVGRGTPSISPLIKWNWNMKIPIPHYIPMKSTLRMFSIDIKNKEWSFLLGHVINGTYLFPASAYFYLVWETVCPKKHKSNEEKIISFRNCKFLKDTYTSPEKVTTLIVNVKSSHKYEIYEDEILLACGEISTRKRNNMDNNGSKNIGFNKESIILNTNDTYKELRLRGRNYYKEFKKIKEYDMIRGRGIIKWNGNWVCFIDNMLQMMILEEDTRSLMVPKRMKYLEIDMAKHLDMVKEDPELMVEINRKSKIIRSGGIEIFDVTASSIPKNGENKYPVLEKYGFVPNEGEFLLDDAIRINVQLVTENGPDNKFKSIEYIDSTSSDNLSLLSPLINNIISNVPLIQQDLTVISKSEISITENIVLMKEIPKNNKYTLLIINGFFLNFKIQDKLIDIVAESGFILSRESSNFDPNANVLESLQLITMYRVGQETLVLLRKINKNFKLISNVIDVSNTTNLEWLPKLQKLTQNNGNIIVYVQDKLDNGVLGLTNCLKHEQNGKNIQAVLIDGLAPSFNLNDSFYWNQLNKGLRINVYKNRKWGTYRYLPLEKNISFNIETNFVKSLGSRNFDSSTCIEGESKDRKRENDFLSVCSIGLNSKDLKLGNDGINCNVIKQNQLINDKLGSFEFAGLNIKEERVMGIVKDCGFAKKIENNSQFIWKIPNFWSMEEAATVPYVYAIVVYALFVRGNVKSGERILIHCGSEEIRMAAINICLNYELEIFIAVETEEKRSYLNEYFPSIPVDHIGNLQDTSFEQMIKLETNGQGVDLVLNSFTKEKLLVAVMCLAHRGRFLQIGQSDLLNDNSLPLELLKFERSFHGIILDMLFDASKEERRALYNLFQQLLDKGVIKPLPRTIFEEHAIEYASGKDIERVIINLREKENLKIVPNVDVKTKAIVSRYSSDPEKVTIILGGLGGFGLELANWLVKRGVRKLVLVSRSGIKTEYQKYRIQIWRNCGCEIHISIADITTKCGCELLITEAKKLGPIQSIFNLAVILEDALFDNQTINKFKISLSPKAYATKYLDEITRQRCKNLRDFVVFSSVSCGRGNIGQTNYGMANSIMERICERRKQDRFPGLAIQWGAIGDVGLISETQETDEILEIGGTSQQRIASCLNLMDNFLSQSNPIVSSMIVADKSNTLLTKKNLVEIIGKILGIKDLKIVSPHSTLSELGMDSVLDTEIKKNLNQELDIIITSQQIRNMTLANLNELQEQHFSSIKEISVISTEINS